MNDQIIFKEIQRFRQIWLQILVLSYAVVLTYGVIKQIVYNTPFGNKPMSDPVLLLVWLLFGIIFPILLYLANLTTEVRQDGLYIRFFPFHFSFHKIPTDNLKLVNSRKYNPIIEYGGWGIRVRPKGRAYSTSGNYGVELVYSDDRSILIGTKKPEELAQAIKSII